MEFRAAKNCAIRSTLTTFLVYSKAAQPATDPVCGKVTAGFTINSWQYRISLFHLCKEYNRKVIN